MSYSKKILIEIEKHLNSYTNQLFGCHLHLFYQILNIITVSVNKHTNRQNYSK